MRRRKRRNKDIKLITLYISFMSFLAACGPYVFVPHSLKNMFLCLYVLKNNMNKKCVFLSLP